MGELVEVYAFPTLCFAAIGILLLTLWAFAALWSDTLSAEERAEVELPKVVPVHARPVPIYLPRRRPASKEDEETAASGLGASPLPDPRTTVPAPPIPLSKFRGMELRPRPLRGAPRAVRRPLNIPATLPRTNESGCEICKGVAIVWISDRRTGWVGVCRRCGLILARVGAEGWTAPKPRPQPSPV